MTEAVFFAALAALLYFTVLFRERPSVVGLAGAGLAALAASLTRYEGWFLIPFTTAYFFWAAHKHRRLAAMLFGVIASLGPILWLVYNGLVFHNLWEFYSGPASAKAIQGGQSYPGYHDWKTAFYYFGEAVRACAGLPLFFIAGAGIVAALWKRAFWPLLLLGLPGVFYIWSIHSEATPIFLPNLWPNGYYNTRYGLVLLPLLAFSGGAIVAVAAKLRPRSITKIVAWTAVASATLPWILNPHPDAWITWKESEVNSSARRAWTKEAADFLASHYRPGEGVLTSFGDNMGVFREAGIPLRATLTGDNGLPWQAAVLRPDLFLWEQWALVEGGDAVQTALNRARRRGPGYELVRQIIVKNAPVIEIYERSSAPRDLYHPPDDNSVPQSARREE